MKGPAWRFADLVAALDLDADPAAREDVGSASPVCGNADSAAIGRQGCQAGSDRSMVAGRPTENVEEPMLSDAAPGVGLADAIELVRSELQTAAEAGLGASIAFRPESVELDFEVVFGDATTTDRSLRVWVTSLGSRRETRNARTQRLKLTMSLVDPATGGVPLLSDERAE